MIIISARDIGKLCSSLNVDEHDAFLLLQYVLDQKYSALVLSKEIKLSNEQFCDFKLKLQMRATHIPVAKIIGYKSFYNHDFITNEHTLDPRPETELIIDLVKKHFNYNNAALSILDLGCGTGCLGLSLLDLYPNAKLLLSDISDAALTVSKKNAALLNVKKRCDFIKTDWFSNISGKFNIIVCNPPYIATNYDLDSDTLHDPHIALFGGKDGLDAYRNIMPTVHKFLMPHGMMFLEVGFNQCQSVCSMTENLQIIEIAKDLQSIERTIVFQVTDRFVH